MIRRKFVKSMVLSPLVLEFGRFLPAEHIGTVVQTVKFNIKKFPSVVSKSFLRSPGDVIRPHTDGSDRCIDVKIDDNGEVNITALKDCDVYISSRTG